MRSIDLPEVDHGSASLRWLESCSKSGPRRHPSSNTQSTRAFHHIAATACREPQCISCFNQAQLVETSCIIAREAWRRPTKFSHAVSAVPLSSSTNLNSDSDKRRNGKANLDENQRRPTIPSCRTSGRPIYSKPDHVKHDVIYRHRSKPQGGPGDHPSRRHSSEGSLKRETSSPTRRPTSTPQYSAPGSTRQLAKFCEEERARFWNAKSANLVGPLTWTARPVPRRFVGLSVVFAVVLTFFFRLWSALLLLCRKRTSLGKLDTAMISAHTMPFDPSNLLLLADSCNGTPTRKHPVNTNEVFKRASSAWPSQTCGDSSRNQRDMCATAVSSTPQSTGKFASSERFFARAVSAGLLANSAYSGLDHGVSYRNTSQGGPEVKPLAKDRKQSFGSILVQKTTDASTSNTRPDESVELVSSRSPSALDQVVIDYLTDRLSSPSPSTLEQAVLDFRTQQALRKGAGPVNE